MRISGLSVSTIDEDELDSEHLVVSCTLDDNGNTIRSYALIDCGAQGYSFVDEEFARRHNLPLHLLETPRVLEVIDGRPIETGPITHLTKIKMIIDKHEESIPMFVTKLGHYPVVLGLPWLKRHDVSIKWSTGTVTFDSTYCHKHCSLVTATIRGITSPLPERHLNISLIGGPAFGRISSAKSRDLVASLGHITVHDIDQEIKARSNDAPEPKAHELVPEQYHDYLKLFEKSVADKLPPHRPYDHRIPLKEGFEPPYGPLYSLSRTELIALREWLDENLSKGFIRASSSPAGAPILFVKKKDGSLRLCVDYRGLNNGTIKNRYPLPLLQETLNRLSKARYFTTLDVRGAYNLVRMAEGEEWKTAFRTRFGLFESLVMPFGLTNAPADFQHFINDTLRPFLDVFCTAYLDDILVYSSTLEEHQEHVKKILEVLSKAGLHLKPEKCEFHKTEVKYLGLVISDKGISMDPGKVETVTKWGDLADLHDVRAFLGFANFYRRFIKGYSNIVAPIVNLTKKDVKFHWSKECKDAFETLKTAFTTAPILMHFDPEAEILVETDASDFVSAGVLSQYGPDGLLHPVAFYSKKHTPAECNYEIYDKELMAIVRCFEQWRSELESSPDVIKVLSDHKNLEYFMSTKMLNRRQARWSEFLSRFNFKIIYRPGKAGAKPDALTRRSGDLPKEGDERLLHQSQTVLKTQNLSLNANEISDVVEEPTNDHPADPDPPAEIPDLVIDPPDNDLMHPDLPIDALWEEGYRLDPIPLEVLTALRQGRQRSKHLSIAECREENDRLLYQDRVYVPNHDPLKLTIMKEAHEGPAAGHPARSKTLELVGRRYYWPGMRKDIERFCRNCHPCKRSRTSRHAPFGMLKPLPIPEGPWQDISMDFVTGLPWSNGCDAIFMVVDRLTKMRHMISCRDTCTAEQLAEIFVRHIFRLHGLPRSIVSDRGTQFVAEFWRALCALLNIEVRLSTPYHPETNGQTERFNAVMEQYLRNYVTYLQDDWESWLPWAEFTANNHASESTGVSPFFANYGYDPRWQYDPVQPADAPPPPAARAAAKIAQDLKEIHDHLRTELVRAQDRYREAADRNRTPAPNLKEGDEVWLNAKNIVTRRPARKLDHRRLGPFRILKVISPWAYKLQLPASIRIHPVQHISLLDPVAQDPFPGQVIAPPPPVEVDGDEEYFVEQVLDARIRYRRLEYLVRWTGYEETSWERAENVNGLKAVDDFHARYPDKPGPLPED